MLRALAWIAAAGLLLEGKVVALVCSTVTGGLYRRWFYGFRILILFVLMMLHISHSLKNKQRDI